MEKTRAGRFIFIDGLRGVAAMLVVFFHLHEAVGEVAADWIHPLIKSAFGYGYLGVDVFFVISGFVISYSVRNAKHTPGFLFRFGVRRSIRLDPPYWLTIVLELLLIKLGLLLFPGLDTPFPSVEKVLVHFVYLQDLLGYGNIVAIFWTLAYEVQFYLVFVSFLVLLRYLGIRFGQYIAANFALILNALLFVFSLLVFYRVVENPLSGLFVERWYQFFIGFLAMRCLLDGRVKAEFLLATVGILAGCVFFWDFAGPNCVTTLVVSWALVYAGLRGKMTAWLSTISWQFLGRISYSLYLVHPVVGWRFIKLLHEIHGEQFTAVQAWFVLASGVAVSVLSAWLMYRFIEAKSLRVCHRVRMDQPLTLGVLKNAWLNRNNIDRA